MNTAKANRFLKIGSRHLFCSCIFTCLIAACSKDSSTLSEEHPASQSKPSLESLSQQLIQSIYNEISRIENNYKPLKGFSKEAVISERIGIQYASLEYKKAIIPASKSSGTKLASPEGCLISIHIQKNLGDSVQRGYSVPQKGLHRLRMANAGNRNFKSLGIEAFVDVNVESDVLLETLHKIIARNFDQFEKDNATN